MGAARPRRWKLPSFHRSGGGSTSSAPSEAVPPEFVCPILGELMADPVILPSGRTYERACAELAFVPPGAEPGGAHTVIPNTALKAAIGSWCARTGRDLPARPSSEAAREAVRRVIRPPEGAAKSVRTNRRPAAVTMASSSNSSYSSPASTPSYGSSSEITPAEDEEACGRPVKAQKETAAVQVVEAAAADPLEDDVVAKVMDADDEEVVTAAMAALREATRESADRRRLLCTPRLLGALRRVLLLHRHAPAQADAAAALANLSLEPANKVRIVRAGAVPALVEALRSSGAEAREHAAGALFGLALCDDNRAAIGVLGAVPPLLDLLASPAQPARARRDAGMALYHLSLAAVNQSRIARFPGAPRALLAVASAASEPPPIRRLALMVTCNVTACAEGRAALIDAGAVASVSAVLLSSSPSPHHAAATSSIADLEELCVAALYAMSRGSLRFRGLARAAGADKALRRVAEEGGGVRREMAKKTLRVMRGDLDEDENDLTGSSLECGDAEDCDGSIVSDGLMSFRRRQQELGVSSSCSNTAEF